MDETASQVAAAIEAIQSATTSAAVRAEAQQFVDSFKESASALNYVLPLFSTENPDSVRHFALSILEFALKYSWRAFDGDTQASIKTMLLELLAGGTKSLVEEMHFIKNKLVDVVLQALIHEWPQRWPDLFPVLTEIGARGDTQAELVLLLFCDSSKELLRLSHAVISGEDSNVTVARRKQICEAFRDSMELLYPFLWGCLNEQGELYEQARAAVLAGAADAMTEFGAKGLLLQATLKGLVSLLNWIPLEMLFDRPVLPLTMPLLSDANCCMLAIEAVETLIARKHVRSAEQHIMALFDYVPALLGALSGGQILDTLEKQHEFNLAVVNCLVEIGLFQFRVYQRALSETPEESVLHPYLQSFLQSMMELGDAHPSLEISTALLSLWRSLLTSGLIPREAKLAENELLTAVLQIQLKTLLVQNPWGAAGPAGEFAQLDFSSEDDAHMAWKALERRATAVLSVLTRFDAHGMVEFASQYLAHVLSLIDTTRMDYEKASEEYRSLRAVGTLFTVILRSMPRQCLVPSDATAFSLDTAFDLFEEFSEVPKTAEQIEAEEAAREATAAYQAQQREVTCATLEAALAQVLAFKPAAPVMLSGKMRIVSGFSPFLKHFPTQLELAFGAAFEQILYRHPTETATHVERLGADSLRVRVKATKTVRLLFLYVGESMTDMLERVWGGLQELENAGELRHEEKVSLYEVVLIAASKSRDDELQQNVVNAIIGPVLAQWCSPELLATIGDCRSLLSCLGVIDNPVSEPAFSEAHMSYRAELYFIVSVLYIVTKWAAGWRSKALLPHMGAIIEPLLTLIATTHQIWMPEVQGSVPAAFEGLYRLPDDSEATALAQASALPQHDLDSGTQMRLLVYWVDSLQSRCYSVLGCLTKLRDLFFVPELGQLLADSVFSGLGSLPSRFVSALHVSVIGPLIRMVPNEAREAVVAPLLVQWLEYMQAKLPAEWQAFYARQESEEKIMSPEEEVLVDTALSRLTVVHARMLQSLSFRLPRAPSDPEDEDAPRVPHLLETEPIRHLFLQSSLILLQCPVLTASSIAVTLCQRLLLHVQGLQDYASLLCNELLPALLAALTHNDEETMLRKVLTLIADIYVALTPMLPDVTRGVLSSVPGVSMDQLAALEAEVTSTQTTRDRREAFREILAHTIGTNIIHRMYKMGEHVKEIDVIAEVNTTEGGL